MLTTYRRSAYLSTRFTKRRSHTGLPAIAAVEITWLLTAGSRTVNATTAIRKATWPRCAEARPMQRRLSWDRARPTKVEPSGLTKLIVLTEEHVDEAPVYSLFKLTNPHSNSKPLLATLQVNGADLEMEGPVVSAETYRTLCPKELAPTRHPANVKLQNYTREELLVLGTATVTVGYQGQEEQLSLLEVEGNGPSLLGRDWLHRIWLNWKELHNLQSSPPLILADVLSQHAYVF